MEYLKFCKGCKKRRKGATTVLEKKLLKPRSSSRLESFESDCNFEVVLPSFKIEMANNMGLSKIETEPTFISQKMEHNFQSFSDEVELNFRNTKPRKTNTRKLKKTEKRRRR
jgi:hypothetical protein